MNVAAPTGLARDVDPAAVLVHDRLRDGEAEAGALAGLLGGEEGLEDALQIGGIDAGPLVGDPHPAALDRRGSAAGPHRRTVTGADQETAAGGHGVDAVQHEVGEHLLYLRGVGMDRGPTVGFDDETHPAWPRDRLQHFHRLQARGAQVDVDGAFDPAARIVEELADERGHAIGLLGDRRRVGFGFGPTRLAGGDQSGADRDHAERRPELVGDARGELADRAQAVVVSQALARGQALAQRRQLVREHTQLVVAGVERRADEVAVAERAHAGRQRGHGFPDQPRAQDGGKGAGQHDDDEADGRGLGVAAPHEGFARGHGLGDLDDAEGRTVVRDGNVHVARGRVRVGRARGVDPDGLAGPHVLHDLGGQIHARQVRDLRGREPADGTVGQARVDGVDDRLGRVRPRELGHLLDDGAQRHGQPRLGFDVHGEELCLPSVLDHRREAERHDREQGEAREELQGEAHRLSSIP